MQGGDGAGSGCSDAGTAVPSFGHSLRPISVGQSISGPALSRGWSHSRCARSPKRFNTYGNRPNQGVGTALRRKRVLCRLAISPVIQGGWDFAMFSSACNKAVRQALIATTQDLRHGASRERALALEPCPATRPDLASRESVSGDPARRPLCPTAHLRRDAGAARHAS
jgi:hypothetical protein